MNRSRITGDLVSQNNIFVDIANDRVGIGSTIPGQKLSLPDNARIALGDSADLQIYHSTHLNNSHITKNESGIFYIDTLGDVQIRKNNGEIKATFISDGAVELYHDGSKKFETSSTGSETTGGLLVDTVDPVLNVGSTYTYKYGYFGDTNKESLTVRGNEACIEVFASDQSFHGGSIVLRGGDEGFGFVNNSSNDRLELISFTASANAFALHNGGANLSNYDKVFVANKNGSIDLYHDGTKKFETMSYGAKWTGILLGADNQKLELGSSGDLSLYHDGTNSYIDNVNTGILRIRGGAGGSGRDIQIQAKNGEYSINAIPDGAVELYHNNVKKFETTSSGVEITGTNILLNDDSAITGTPNTYQYGRGTGSTSGLSLYGGESALEIVSNDDGTHGGSILIRTTTDGAGFVYNPTDHALEITMFTPSGSFAIHNNGSNTTQDTQLRIVKDGAVELNYDGGKKLETTSTGVSVTGGITATSHITLPDDVRLKVGTGEDLHIYHNQSNSVIREEGTGNLNIQTTGGNVEILTNTTETSAKFISNGAVELYHDNTKMAYTSSSGFEVTNGSIISHLNIRVINDNQKLLIGAGNDLQVYHDGTSSYVSNRTGNLYIESKSGETAIQIIPDGAVDLRHNGTKKLETTSSGVDVTGRLLTDGVFVGDGGDNDVSVSMGANNDLRLYHDGSHSYIKDRGTGNLYIQSNHVNIDTDHGEQMINCIKNGAIELYHDNAKKFETYSGGAKVHHTSFTTFEVRAETNDAALRLTSQNNDDNDWTVQNDYSEGYRLDFRHNNDRKMYLDSSGNLTITGHFDVGDGDKLRLGNSDDLQIYHSGSHSYIQDSGAGDLVILSNQVAIRNAAETEDMARFIQDGAVELYHNNSKKFETVSNGAKVSGQTETTGDMVIGGELNLMGSSDDHKYLDCRIGGNTFHIRKTTGGDSGHEIMAHFHGNAEVGLYYNGVTKFITTNTGVSVTGNVVASGNMQVNDNNYLYAGNGGDLRLSHNGSHSFINNQTGDLSIQTDGNFKIEAKDGGKDIIHGVATGACEIHYDGGRRIETTSAGAKITGVNGSNPTLQIEHSNVDTEGEVIRVERMVQPTIRYHSIKARHSGSTNNNHIAFHIHDPSTNTTSQVEALKILGSGNLTYSQQATTILANPNDVSLIDDSNDNNNPIHFASTYVNKGGMSVTESRSRVTVPLYGTYLVTGCLSGSITAQSQGDGIQIAILKNGSHTFASGNDGTFPVESYGTVNGMEYGFTVALPVVASANDYFELTFLNIGASEASLARGYFSVTKLH